MIEKIKWRGTWGVGDALMALNVAHNYAWKKKKKVNLEMHWAHSIDHLESEEDTETIIERMDWLHDQYYRKEDVYLTHIYHSTVFDTDNMSDKAGKTRFMFGSGAMRGTIFPEADWPFKKELYRNHIKTKRITIWTPTYNTQPPRYWKRFLTSDDWYDIIKLLKEDGWIVEELNYRTPVKEAFNTIRKSDYVVCYDGMWHYIARNLGIPTFIPSWEPVTPYHVPQVVSKTNKEDVMEFFKDFTETNRKQMDDNAKVYLLDTLSKFFDGKER